MAFDDLARHMASRDRKKLGTGNANQIVAEAAAADRRMARQRDLILGPLLLVMGLVAGIFAFKVANAPASAIDRAGGNGGGETVPTRYFVLLGVLAVAALAAGARQTYRGLRNRSHLASPDEADPLDWLNKR